MSTFSVNGLRYEYYDSKVKKWLTPTHAPELEKQVKGFRWFSNNNHRTLIYNLSVPTVKKNVDLCLLDCSPDKRTSAQSKNSALLDPENYLALGELKGGIDPAGADEHWKTANTALERIRRSFSNFNCYPKTFFIGAAIENSMAKEIFKQLNDQILSNGANLTKENQVVSLCDWLIKI